MLAFREHHHPRIAFIRVACTQERSCRRSSLSRRASSARSVFVQSFMLVKLAAEPEVPLRSLSQFRYVYIAWAINGRRGGHTRGCSQRAYCKPRQQRLYEPPC